MRLLGSKAQEGVLSGVERCPGSREECDCLRLLKKEGKRKKNSRGKKRNRATNTNLYSEVLL